MRALKLLKYAIMILGLCLLFGGIYHVFETRAFLDKAEPADGTVVRVVTYLREGAGSDVHPMYRPVVRFTSMDGRQIEFEGSSTSFSWLYRIGDPVSVWYYRASPMHAMIGGWYALWSGPAIAILFGGLISLIFVAAYASKAYEVCAGVYLRLRGIPVRTTFVEARLNQLNYVNDVHAYNIVSRWRDPRTGRTYEFVSPNVWSDLSQYSPDGEITVYMSPEDPGEYRMDMSFLSTMKPSAVKDPIAAETDATAADGWEAPLGTAVRANWGYLAAAPLFGSYISLLQPIYEFPMELDVILFFTVLGLAMWPVIRRKVPIAFWFVAIGLWVVGMAFGAVLRMATG